MTTTPPPTPDRRPGSSLVQHDIQLARDLPQGPKVVARVACEHLGCAVLVESCRRCPRFVRIEVHEAGYILLCRDQDDTTDPGVCDAPQFEPR